jgi:hypothetical protein
VFIVMLCMLGRVCLWEDNVYVKNLVLYLD